MITRMQITAADLPQLLDIRQQLVVEKMKLDREFTDMLDTAELPEDDVDTEQWDAYRSRLKDYGLINNLLDTTNYYIKRHGRSAP